MKCPVCGRENPDIRLFCMQCGELLPETDGGDGAEAVQDENIYARPEPGAPFAQEEATFAREEATFRQEEAPEVRQEEILDVPEASEYPVGPFAEISGDDDGTEFYRQRQRARGLIEEAWPEEPKPAPMKPASIFDEPDEAPESAGNLYSRPAAEDAPRRPELNRQSPVNGRGSTYIPRRESSMDPDDFFAVRGQVLPEYEDEPERPKRRRSREGDYEERVHQSFAVRHMRGIVTLMLLLITAVIVIVWANTDSAQYALAKADIAWKSDAYARLAEEAYMAKDLAAAGYYYSAALAREEGNINYAIMAANSYIEGGYTSKALDALRECIALQPSNADLYATLLQLQPDIADISASDRQLIRQGYELTGDSRLNIE